MLVHGSPEMKEKYLPRMISGEWTGTMCLTEPQCGSDLNQVHMPLSLPPAHRATPIGFNSCRTSRRWEVQNQWN
jgi:hypothetical protein